MAQLLARLDQGEEHAELRAVEPLEEPAEDVVVVEEVLAALRLEVLEGLLQLREGVVEHLEEARARLRRLDPRDALDDAEPLLDVELHVQRSEYAADDILVDNRVRAIEEALRNLDKVVVRDRTLLQKELRDALMPMVDSFVVR